MGTGKTKYFTEIHAKMTADPEKSFWDDSPIHDTLLGRVVSYVIFRSVGVDSAKYVREKFRKQEPMANTPITSIDEIEMDFLSAWQADPYLTALQNEGMAFRSLMQDRDFQLWLSETLSKIPLQQWDKARHKFTKQCDNALYISLYSLWAGALRGVKVEYFIDRLPPLPLLMRYLLSRTVRGYTLDNECDSLVVELREKSSIHAQATINSFKQSAFAFFKAQGEYECSITEEGLEFYKEAAVLSGLWCRSLTAPPEGSGMDGSDVLSGAVTALIAHGSSRFDKLRAYYLNKWTDGLDNRNPKDASAEVTMLRKEIRGIEKAARKSDQRRAELEGLLEKSNARANGLDEKLTAAVKRAEHAGKQNSSLRAKIDALRTENPTYHITKKKFNGATEDTLEALTIKVENLSSGLSAACTKIDDLYALLSAGGDADESQDTVFAAAAASQDWTRQIKAFKGRLVLFGGHPTWQDRVREWFESNGIKVRVLTPGDDVSGIRSTDTVLLHTIENKHKYSAGCINHARRVGAELRILSATRLDTAIRAVFDSKWRYTSAQ